MKKKNYKMKKKDWLMLLDFWPLSIVTPAMLILILFGSALGWGGQMKPKKTKKPRKVKGKKKKQVNGYYIANGKIKILYDEHWSTK